MFSTQKLQGKRHAIIKFKWLGLMNSLKKGPLVENCPAIFVFRSERESLATCFSSRVLAEEDRHIPCSGIISSGLDLN